MTQTEAEFDQYDSEYKQLVEDAMNFSNLSHDYVTQIKADLIVEEVERRWGGLEGRKVLDVGCGVGLTDAVLPAGPWELFGTDVSEKSVERARERNTHVTYEVGAEDRLPYDDETFDLCFTICVMHHVPPAQWTGFLKEMRRVLKPGGVVMVLEHNPYNPLTRLVVNRCPFDADAVLLSRSTLSRHMEASGLERSGVRYFLFTPWERLRFLDRALGWLPMGAQYGVTAVRP